MFLFFIFLSILNPKPSLYWVYFKDQVEGRVNPRYIRIIENMGARKRVCSNLLNACSFFAGDEIKEIEKLWFVKKVEPVRIGRVRISKEEKERLYHIQYDSSFTGYTYTQLKLFDINRVHDRGYLGEGVKIGFLDTGLRKDNFALRSIKIEKEHDFITGDDIFIELGKNRITACKNFSIIECFWIVPTQKFYYILFIADSTPSLPTKGTERQCFFTYSSDGYSWRPPLKFSSSSFSRNLYASADGNILAASWEGGESSLASNIYISLIRDTLPFYSEVLSTSGRKPVVGVKNDTLVILWFEENRIKLKEGVITENEVSWFYDTTLFEYNTKSIFYPKLIYQRGWILMFADFLKGKILKYNMTGNEKDSILLENLINFDPFVYRDTIFMVVSYIEETPKLELLRWSDENPQKEMVWDLFVQEIKGTTIEDRIGILLQSYGKILYMEYKNGYWIQTELTQDFSYLPFITEDENDFIKGWCIRGDDDTDYDPAEDALSQPNHGTRITALVGGYVPGNYIGVAPASVFYMAKTEKVTDINEKEYEVQIEEDTWIEGLEWLEREGVDIVNSSLGYSDWYTYEDMDGKTSAASIAASLAAKRGLVIVTAMGNVKKDHPYMVAPADAEGVVSVGGIMRDSSWWGFSEEIIGSAIGPTYDGRRKPELVALADSVWAVDSMGFRISAGTSYATAFVSGIFSLVLSAHPEWRGYPDSLKEAVFKTASNYSSPNDTIGYGIPNAFNAVYFTPPKGDSIPEDRFLSPFPNPYYPLSQNKIYFPFMLQKGTSSAILQIYSISGKRIITKEIGKEEGLSIGIYESKKILETIGAFWDGKDEKKILCPSGLYIVVLYTGHGKMLEKFMLIR